MGQECLRHSPALPAASSHKRSPGTTQGVATSALVASQQQPQELLGEKAVLLTSPGGYRHAQSHASRGKGHNGGEGEHRCGILPFWGVQRWSTEGFTVSLFIAEFKTQEWESGCGKGKTGPVSCLGHPGFPRAELMGRSSLVSSCSASSCVMFNTRWMPLKWILGNQMYCHTFTLQPKQLTVRYLHYKCNLDLPLKLKIRRSYLWSLAPLGIATCEKHPVCFPSSPMNTTCSPYLQLVNAPPEMGHPRILYCIYSHFRSMYLSWEPHCSI